MKKKKQPFFSADAVTKHVSSVLTATIDSLAQDRYDADIRFLLNSQKVDFTKKYCSPELDTTDMSLDAFILFLQVNERMKHVSNYPFPNSRFSGRLPRDQQILLRAKNIIARVLGEFVEDEFLANCKHSSGSTIGVNYQNSSIEAKLGKLTYTEGVQRWFQYYLSYDSQLRSVLDSHQHRYELVRGSKAVTVPKDNKKVRMICVEPCLNMFFQQGLMHCLTTRLEKVGLSFSSQQDRNRQLAWYGSLTGTLATIDWSSASDTLNYDLIKFLLPHRWFYYLDQFRCGEIEILGVYEKLHMFSTMGNACTFPLETLVFWAFAVASVSLADQASQTLVDERFFYEAAVFGDDCILPVQDVPTFLGFMERFGFLPNASKSYWEGPFRESCGNDFLAGKDVRPFFLTGPGGSSKHHMTAWLNIMLNRLTNRFIRIWGPLAYIYHASPVYECIFELFRQYKLELFLVPTYFPDDAGVKIGSDFLRFRRHFNIKSLMSTIAEDRHGTKHFRYLRVCYPKRVETSESVHYWLFLKGLEKEAPKYSNIKRNPSYVTAKGLSPCFVINYH